MPSVKKQYVTRIIQTYLNEYYMEEIRAKDLETLTWYTSNSCERIFKEVTGISIFEYLSNIRFEKARELLETTSMKNYEIVYAVGYNSSTRFMQEFRRRYGVTMRKYRLTVKC